MADRVVKLADFELGKALASKTTMARCAVGLSRRMLRAISALSCKPTTVCFADYSSASPPRAFIQASTSLFPPCSFNTQFRPAPQASLFARKRFGPGSHRTSTRLDSRIDERHGLALALASSRARAWQTARVIERAFSQSSRRTAAFHYMHDADRAIFNRS